MSGEHYQEYLSKIKDNNLKNSIIAIKQTADKIWNPDVRIITDFTGHGTEHSERIFGKLACIIEPGKAIKLLSEKELYILILGVVLHDIGMQCDVKKHPNIKEVAIEQFGASFKVDFSEGTASSYTQVEKNELRKNHHLLTAAWLACVFLEDELKDETMQSLKSVPEELREVLIDVCRFHSKLNITECPEKDKISKLRTQFIAALLRLGDELDIDKYRVDIATVKLYGYDVENSYFWYLHKHTVINFENNLICINILLNKKDYKKYEKYFSKKGIQEFITKNSGLIDIIVSNGITIGISQNSAVLESPYYESLPLEICTYINGIIDKTKARSDGQIINGPKNTQSLGDNFTCNASSVRIPIDDSSSKQKECIENILNYFCKINKEALKLNTDIEAVIVVWTEKHIKRRTFYSCNKPKGAILHNVRDYSYGVVGMLQKVLNENNQRTDCILFYDHEKNAKECEYIIEFRTNNVERLEVEEQEWKRKGTKAMLAISLFTQIDDIPQVFGALTFDFAETLKLKGPKQKGLLFKSVRECRDVLLPLLVSEIKTDFGDQLMSLRKEEEKLCETSGEEK